MLKAVALFFRTIIIKFSHTNVIELLLLITRPFLIVWPVATSSFVQCVSPTSHTYTHLSETLSPARQG